MLFNSIDFGIFLPIVFVIYWLISKKNISIQNLLLLVASYVFYGWWDWRFLLLVLFSTIVDFSIGIALENEKKELRRRILLWTSIAVNLGFLGFFKYYNFFIENFVDAFSFLGYSISHRSLGIILPVGISFYTFQTLSYTIDVYNGKLKTTRDFIAFAAFISFFPQLVAGPIERATNLLPQFCSERKFDYSKAIDGLRQILWGLFKKVVIADNCAEYANLIFNNSSNYSGSTLLLGAVLFTFQIYGDFSGYSDIAIGTSRLFGFSLMKNFAFPYFSRDIAEFWRRWHISLSTWFRDYLYIPLGGSRGGEWMKFKNTLIIFLVSGFWHGANWTFIVWGGLNAMYFFISSKIIKNSRNSDIVAKGRLLPSTREFLQILFTFSLTVFAWIFFRSDNMGHAASILDQIFSFSTISLPELLPYNLFILISIFLIIEWGGRENQYGLEKLGLNWNRPLRLSFYYGCVLVIFLFGGKEQEFIYFQF
jgi:D-alanyl-lipoteichoic acid acyltransferase DltB (MBOAT superfamily)